MSLSYQVVSLRLYCLFEYAIFSMLASAKEKTRPPDDAFYVKGRMTSVCFKKSYVVFMRGGVDVSMDVDS